MKFMPITVALVVIVLLAIVLMFGADIIGGPAIIGTAYAPPDELSSIRLTLLLTAADQIVSMLTTIAVGLTIVVGFALREFWTQRAVPDNGIRLAALVFVASLFGALFYAFAARQQAFEFVAFEHHDFLSLKDLFVMQAVSVAFEAASAFYLLVAGYLPKAHEPVGKPQIAAVVTDQANGQEVP